MDRLGISHRLFTFCSPDFCDFRLAEGMHAIAHILQGAAGKSGHLNPEPLVCETSDLPLIYRPTCN